MQPTSAYQGEVVFVAPASLMDAELQLGEGGAEATATLPLQGVTS